MTPHFAETKPENRVVFDYEDEPPRCGNCKAMKSSPSTPRVYFCSYGKFFVRPVGICNKWLGKVDGATLDTGVSTTWREAIRKVGENLSPSIIGGSAVVKSEH